MSTNLSTFGFTEAYDLGAEDFFEGRARRVPDPRNANASDGRRGYAAGYRDAEQHRRDSERVIHDIGEDRR